MGLNKLIDYISQMKFFNQRAGRELWNDKPIDVQNQDILSNEKKMTEIEQYLLKSASIPKIDWKQFKGDESVSDIAGDEPYLVLLKITDGDGDLYTVDIAVPYGDYIDNFWDTDCDYIEGNVIVTCLMYAELGMVRDLEGMFGL